MGFFQGIKQGVMQGELDMMIGIVSVKANCAVNKITEKIIASDNGLDINKVSSDVKIMFCDEIVKYVNEYIVDKYSDVNIDYRDILNGNQPRETKICYDIIRESDNIINDKAINISKTIENKYNVKVEDEIKNVYKYKIIEKEDETMDIVKKFFKF